MKGNSTFSLSWIQITRIQITEITFSTSCKKLKIFPFILKKKMCGLRQTPAQGCRLFSNVLKIAIAEASTEIFNK